MADAAKPDCTFQDNSATVPCLLGLGSNLGDRQLTLDEAIRRLNQDEASRVTAVSRSISSRPIGGPGNQAAFLNAAVTLETTRSPHELLHIVQTIETQLGRKRGEPWMARTLDLDLLLYGDHVIRDAQLEVPHPWMVARQFVLEPSAEIAGTWTHPVIGWTVDRLWRHACDATPNYSLVSDVRGGDFAGVAKRLDAVWIADPSNIADASAGGIESTAGSAGAVDSPEGSSVRTSRSGIKCLQQAHDALTQAGWNISREQPILLSEFWYEEFVHRWRERTSSHTAHQGGPHEFQGVRSIAPAKLVIVIASEDRSASSDDVHARSTMWAEQELMRLGVSPFIVIRSARRDDQERLLMGAVEAMENR